MNHAKNELGFSLIEVIVSASIIVLLVSVSLPNLSAFRERKRLEASAESLASLLAELQNGVMTGQDFGAGVGSYGVRLQTGEVSGAFVFFDADSDRRYDREEQVERLSVFYSGKISISELSPREALVGGQVLDVVFLTPRGDIALNASNSFDNVAEVVLTQAGKKETQTITINPISGNIYWQHP